jgi:hypothetical protein
VLAIFDTISDGYQIVGLLHVLAVIIAFGPLFVYPSLQRADAGATLAKLHLRLVLPALALAGVLGVALVEMSDDAWEFSQTWVVLALIGWVALMLVSWFLIRPSLTDGSDQARAKMASGIGVTHVLLIVMLYLMIFKPGL